MVLLRNYFFVPRNSLLFVPKLPILSDSHCLQRELGTLEFWGLCLMTWDIGQLGYGIL